MSLIDVLQPQQVDGAVVVAAVVHGQHLHVGRQRLPEKRSLENKINSVSGTTKRVFKAAQWKHFWKTRSVHSKVTNTEEDKT